MFRKAVNFAWYGGAVAGKNVIALLSGRRTKPYRPADLGWAIPLHTTGVGQIGRTIWFGGTFALRVHYLMCGFRSPRFSQKLGFAKIGVTLFKTDKEDNMKKIFWGDTKDANLGLLLMRLFTGGAMLTHGVPKLFYVDKFTRLSPVNLPMRGFSLLWRHSLRVGAVNVVRLLPPAALYCDHHGGSAFVHGADPLPAGLLCLPMFVLLFMFNGAQWSTDALIRR